MLRLTAHGSGRRPDKRGTRDNAAPARPQQAPGGVHHLAKAIKVRNFKLLVAELGEENLAVLLDVTVQRVQELAQGLNFTEEFAYHAETSLGLPSGFLDQVNPALSQEERARLKTLEHGQQDEQRNESVSPPLKEQPPVLNETKESSMPATAEAGRKNAAQPDETALREIRRQNFELLTDRQGAKTQLAKITGLSAANISHRVHGMKIFDAETGVFFAEKLGLPKHWFDQPRQEADIPRKALELLSPDGKPQPRREPSARRPAGGAAKTGAKRGRKPRAAAAPAAKSPGTVPERLAPASSTGPIALTTIPRRQTPAAPAAAAPAPAAAAAAVTPRAAAEAARGSAAEEAILSVGGGVSPVATALLKTLAQKARDGRLSEDAALKMLVEVAAL